MSGRQNESASAVSSPAEAELARHRLRIQGAGPDGPNMTVEVVVAADTGRRAPRSCCARRHRVRLLTALTAFLCSQPAKKGPAHRGADQTQTWSWHREARGRIGSQTIGGPGGGTAKLRDWRDGVRGASGLPLHNLGRALAPRGPSAGCGGIPGKTGASPDRRRGGGRGGGRGPCSSYSDATAARETARAEPPALRQAPKPNDASQRARPRGVTPQERRRLA